MESLTEQQEIDRDIDLWEMEQDWKSSQKKRSEVEWLVVFPQAKSKWGKMILSTLKSKLWELDWKIAWVKFTTKKRLMTKYADVKEQQSNDEVAKFFAREQLKDLEKQVNYYKEQVKLFHRIGNKKLEEKQKVTTISPEMIQKAKEFPLNQLIEINRQGFAKCIWHNDKHASMFCKKNFAHCFACNNSGDTIAVLMHKEGIGFREAVLKLQ